MVRRGGLVCIVMGALALSAAPAQAGTKHCDEPGVKWSRASAKEAGMDGALVKKAVDYASSQSSFAVRVYRYGCLVAENGSAPESSHAKYQSWSFSKSVVSLAFGRAMTLGLISPDDPVGALLTQADQAHGRVTMRNLLTMTGGFRWTALRDYNILTPDRLGNALTVGFDHEPGTWFEYSQNGPALAAAAIGRAVGRDFQDFIRDELFTPLGIQPGNWFWDRDTKGTTQAFFGLHMRTDDYARLGELMRRGGVWHGVRLLSRRYVREAVASTPTNGCYGWFIWLNAAKPCVSPTIVKRPVSPTRDFPTLPPDFYRYSGLFGQIVAVFPTQGVMVARNGLDSPVSLSGGGWEKPTYETLMKSITDMKVPRPADADDKPPALPEEDYGFQTSLAELDQVAAGEFPPPLPPAGPERSRAVLISDDAVRASAKGVAAVRLWCPSRSPRHCQGMATLAGAGAPVSFDIAPGTWGTARLKFKRATFGRLARNAKTIKPRVTAVTHDATPSGTPASLSVTVKPPLRAARVTIGRRATVAGGRLRVRVHCPKSARRGCSVAVGATKADVLVARRSVRIRRGKTRVVALRAKRLEDARRLRITVESRAKGRLATKSSRTVVVD